MQTRPLEAGVRPVISPNTNSGFVVGTADVADLSRTVKRKAAGGLPVLLEFSSNIGQLGKMIFCIPCNGYVCVPIQNKNVHILL
eukprot:1316577-Amorphochlora_amoeboformis.AAC.1